MISMIAAIGNNREIGYKNRLPWKRMDADMRFFHSFISRKVVIMGARSYVSLPIELGWKLCVVVSQDDAEPKYPRTRIVSSVQEAVQVAEQESGEGEIVVAGGASIYEQLLPKADVLYLTLIHADFPNADRFFPKWNENEWEQTQRTDHTTDHKNPYDYSFVVLKRTPKNINL